MSTLDSRLISPIFPSVERRNELIDYIFYDTGALTIREKNSLSSLRNREGSVIVVTPGQSIKGIYEYETTDRFLESKHKSVKALVVAGVGSSVIGTAALARNVANAFDIEVAGVVSGYGASDLISEAIGGWFFYEATDALRHQLRQSIAGWDMLVRTNPFGLPFSSEFTSRSPAKPATRDIDAVTAVLEAPTANFSLVVGHSKGSLLLNYGLEHIATKQKGKTHRYFEELNIVTFGAVTNFAPQFKKVRQYIGSLDWFGGLNSRLDIEHHLVPNAWHHLNTQFPLHVSAQTLLTDNISLE